jgi:hypothetical protein
MRWYFGLWIAGSLAAQEMAPVGLVRGDLSLLLVRAGKGTLDIRTSSGTVYRCDFDAQSLIERENLPVAASTINEGEPLEILADRQRDRCYARIIRVVRRASPAAAAAASRARLRLSLNPIDHIYPRGNLTFSGIIVRLNPSMLVLRTRTEPEKVITLREDTKFLDSGLPAERSSLAVNKRVFIRGSKTLDNTLEAYQVIWGEIAGPKSRSSF